ncbi:hydrolase, metallo-beta-lactamase superfamily [Thermococcus kodakarensis KOD1]|uniref:Hydrolase, metallo-beta-lactamase superfamily n=1 Tax=Thermococcus kodakarensis (strain ATCC BAA-918 / JCM 12380 / KOD1) TaxID=69014 RepID=Q5JFY8_THEKO|nr:MBL fold metallo-hydrolase [Thermococcus kodakarensis]WCN28391.1 MBL fold metallo-hydrolase [Thermococcus kodakarensis]WCN30687.1 MBL fold metallo-hydrolase [Thermococcus kodakarensis]BAD84503.1 hydrolase, metallo-beta-lactamase superfamily [Thermococcus kodakarensis KOD1]
MGASPGRGFPSKLIPIEVPPHVVMLRGIGRDSNIYLVRDEEEALIIDTGTGINWHLYTEIWEREGYLTDVEHVTIFNTHEHFDHVGGNKVLQRWLEERGIEVSFAAHKITANVLERGDEGVILSYFYGRRFEPHQVDFKLEDGDKLNVSSLELLVVHTPGHTAGSSCLYLDDGKHRVMFTGDTVFKGTVGRTDLPTGDGWALRESLERLAEFDVDFGFPGHGDYIRDWKENLREVLRWLP